MTEKNREPLTVFRWRKDADGYALGDDGRITRRGGQMIEYDPAKVRPPLQRVFAELQFQTAVGSALAERPLSDNPAAPFHKRKFEDMPQAVLAFVNEYGFLGSDRSGADADSEDVDYLLKLATNLSAVRHWNEIQKMKTPLNRALTAAGVLREVISGPSLRMVMRLDPKRGRMQLYYEPESLYAWMWLRTADDLSSGIDWSGKPCLYCHEPMGRGPGGHRLQATFCCAKHRTYFHRMSVSDQQRHTAEATALAREEGRP